MHHESTIRKARLEWPLDVVDLEGKAHSVPAGLCEIEEHHSFVGVHVGEVSRRRVVRIPHARFQALFATRQVVYTS
eukprot:gene279-biopygen202